MINTWDRGNCDPIAGILAAKKIIESDVEYKSKKELMRCKIINGKQYPLWSQFVEQKEKWIGGVLEDHDMGMYAKTIITDISLEPNGKDSAYFSVKGEEFTCAFDVKHGGITAGDEGWLTFSGYGGHIWRIRK